MGVIHTPHGKIQTPGYVPVATNGAVKSVTLGAADVDSTAKLFLPPVAPPSNGSMVCPAHLSKSLAVHAVYSEIKRLNLPTTNG